MRPINRLKYSFPTEEKATELITALVNGVQETEPISDEQKDTDIHNVTVTKHTHGLHYMGRTDVTEYNEETNETIIIKKGTTFDVDVHWRGEPLKSWEDFEVNPKSPNHTWS
jgi:hypothetical protein